MRTDLVKAPSSSSFGNCTSLRRDIVGQAQEVFLGRSFFGNCTSLRPVVNHPVRHAPATSQFLRELHFTGVGGD